MLYTDGQEMGFVTEYGLQTGKGCSFLFLFLLHFRFLVYFPGADEETQSEHTSP